MEVAALIVGLLAVLVGLPGAILAMVGLRDRRHAARMRAARGNSAHRIRCEHVFVTSQGSAYARFRRALGSGNPHLVRVAAIELGRVQLEDALAVCLVFLDAEPQAFRPAATRWHARFVLERRASPADAQLALAALHALADGDRVTAARTLAALCKTYQLPRAADAVTAWTAGSAAGDS